MDILKPKPLLCLCPVLIGVGGGHLTSLSLTLPVSKMEQTPLEKVGTGAQETSPFLWTKCWADLIADLIVANKEREPSSDEKRAHILLTSSGLISLCRALCVLQ